MTSAFDYREMARECLAEADATDDPVRRQALQDIAKLYIQTAMDIGVAELPSIAHRKNVCPLRPIGAVCVLYFSTRPPKPK